MTITNGEDLLASNESKESDRRLCATAAAALVMKYGVELPREARAGVFKFMSGMLLKVSDVQKEMLQVEETGVMPNQICHEIAQFTQDPKDLSVDEANQSVLTALSQYPVAKQVVEVTQKGVTVANEITTFTLGVGQNIVEVLRMRPLDDPEAAIVYSIDAGGAISDSDLL